MEIIGEFLLEFSPGFQMDVSAFSGAEFDPREWINQALRREEPGQAREAAAGSLVMRLQLMIARVNSALEEQCQGVVQAVPRVVRAVSSVRRSFWPAL